MMYDKLIRQLRNCAMESAPCKACDMVNDESCTDGLMKQAADAIEELSAVLKVQKAVLEKFPRWIPVTERLPRDRQFVLVYCGDNKRIRPSDRFDVAILLGDSIFTSLGVTHWMPLPEPPKEK